MERISLLWELVTGGSYHPPSKTAEAAADYLGLDITKDDQLVKAIALAKEELAVISLNMEDNDE